MTPRTIGRRGFLASMAALAGVALVPAAEAAPGKAEPATVGPPPLAPETFAEAHPMPYEIRVHIPAVPYDAMEDLAGALNQRWRPATWQMEAEQPDHTWWDGSGVAHHWVAAPPVVHYTCTMWTNAPPAVGDVITVDRALGIVTAVRCLAHAATRVAARPDTVHVYVEGVDPMDPSHQALVQQAARDYLDRYGRA